MRNRRSVVLLWVVLLVAGSCGDGASMSQNRSGLPTLGVLRQMNDDSTAPDSDGDYIRDDVEALIGTNPNDRDSDRDGLMDNAEVFGTGELQPDSYVPDLNNDGLVAAVDSDDDSDGVNDGYVVDTDRDGIPNYYEYYGYTYDWLTGSFERWDGDPDVTYYRTDPLQPSTDQDAYPDGMEVSGAFMDVSVEDPGNHPLVPAYPDIVVELHGYKVTLNEQVTYSEGGSLSRGQSWERQTTNTYTNETEINWNVGTDLEFAGSLGLVNATVRGDFGMRHNWVNTTSTSVVTGASVISQQDWSCARSSNPVDAARMKLLLKARNVGTACLSNIVPTLTLRIGGANVATFEPGSSPISILAPGGVYPPEAGVFWVVDSVNTGAGVAPLSLTMTELRALESGAPVSITVTQLAGDVMLMDEGGVWRSVGDCNQYVTRCEAVSAMLRIAPGDAQSSARLVYADDSPSAPPVSLRDAILWGCGGFETEGGVRIRYSGERGETREASLDGWDFAIDPETLERNGWTAAGPPHPGFTISEIMLGPKSTVILKAPPATEQRDPVIFAAYVDLQSYEVKVCARDYVGIRRVVFVDNSGTEFEMVEDMAGSGFYTWWLDPGYVFVGTESVRVENLDDGQVTRNLNLVYDPAPPVPQAPQIEAASLDLANHRVYAQVIPDADWPLEWVRAYHPALDDGFVEMRRPSNFFEDEYGWEADLPAFFAATNDIRIVAYVQPGVYTVRYITDEDVVDAWQAGYRSLEGKIDWTATDWWRVNRFDLDTSQQNKWEKEENGWKSTWPPEAETSYEVFVRSAGDSDHKDSFLFVTNQPCKEYTGGKLFDEITSGDCAATNPTELQSISATSSIEGRIYILLTSEGRWAKIRIVDVAKYSDWWADWNNCYVKFDYVVFRKPSE